jgi:hypothetical protein
MNCQSPTADACDLAAGLKPDSIIDRYSRSSGMPRSRSLARIIPSYRPLRLRYSAMRSCCRSVKMPMKRSTGSLRTTGMSHVVAATAALASRTRPDAAVETGASFRSGPPAAAAPRTAPSSTATGKADLNSMRPPVGSAMTISGDGYERLTRVVATAR